MNLKFDRDVAEMPDEFQGDTTISTFNPAATGFKEILYVTHVFSLVTWPIWVPGKTKVSIRLEGVFFLHPMMRIA